MARNSKYGKYSKKNSGTPWSVFLYLLILLCAMYYFVSVRQADDAILLDADEKLELAYNEIKLLKQQLEGVEHTEKEKEEVLLEVQKDLSSQVHLLESQLHLLQQKHSEIEKQQQQAKTEDSGVIKRLQTFSEQLSRMKFGSDRARVIFETSKGHIVIETAPYATMPQATYWFLALADAGYWDTCGIIRNAPHVLQANCNGRIKPTASNKRPGIPFQEYNPEYIHHKHTLGIAGRPGGPDFYFNLQDNLKAHGPGGQGGTDADPCFAKMIKGEEIIIALHKELPNGFLKRPDFFPFSRVRILQPSEWEQYQ